MEKKYELKLSENKRNGWKEHIPPTKENMFLKYLDRIIDRYGADTYGSYRASFMVDGGYGKNPETGATIMITYKGTLNKIYKILKLPVHNDNASSGSADKQNDDVGIKGVNY